MEILLLAMTFLALGGSYRSSLYFGARKLRDGYTGEHGLFISSILSSCYLGKRSPPTRGSQRSSTGLQHCREAQSPAQRDGAPATTRSP